MPSLADEKNTYALWNWTWTADRDSATISDPKPIAAVSDPDVHYETENDDLWTYLQMYRRTGNPIYLHRAEAWARYFKEDYRACKSSSPYLSYCYDRDAFGLDHLYGWGLIELYESSGDTAALNEAKALAADLAVMYSPQTPFQCLPRDGCMHYGPRQIGRHLIFATRIAGITKDPAHIALRDNIIRLVTASPMWDATHGTYFVGEFSTDASLGTGAYAAGARINSAFSLAIVAEAMFKAYTATGNTILKDRLIAMARFVSARGLDPTYQYTGSGFGVVNGQTWHSYSNANPVTFWDPVYTTSLVNVLVMGYKFTGDQTLLDKAKVFFNRGTKGVYGSPTARAASDNQVAHFIDTQWDSSSGYFYLAHNKGELQYTYLIFENGGRPTVEAGSTPVVPDSTPPTISLTSPLPNTTVSGSSVLIAASGTDNVGISTVRFTVDEMELATDAAAPYSIDWNSTLTTNGLHVVKAIARDAAGNQTTSQSLSVNVSNATSAPADTTPPAVTITTPAPQATVSGSTTTLSATATDNVGIAGVRFALDGASLGMEDTAAPYGITWNSTTATNGVHVLTAVARDAAGNQMTSAIMVTVNNAAVPPPSAPTIPTPPDKTPPAVSITSPRERDTVNGLQVSVSADASDNLGVTAVQFTLDGVPLGSEDVSAPFAATWDTTQGRNGNHMLGAIARDAAGNHTLSASIKVHVQNTGGGPSARVSIPAISGTKAHGNSAANRKGVSVGVDAAASDDSKAEGVPLTDGSQPRDLTKTTSAIVRNPPVGYSFPKDGLQKWTLSTDSSASESGAIEIVPADSAYAPAAASLVSYRKNGVLVHETAIQAAQEIRSGSVYVDIAARRSATVTMTNLNDLEANVEYTLTDFNGMSLGSSSFTLPPHSKLSAFPFPSLSSVQGLLTFESSAPIIVTSLRTFTNERGDKILSAIPVNNRDSQAATQTLPLLISGAGYATEVILANPGTSVLEGAIQFRTQSIAGTNSVNPALDNAISFTYRIPPLGVVRRSLGNFSSAVVGSARVLPAAGSGAPAVLATLTFVMNGVTVSETTFSGLPVSTALRMYVETSGGQQGIETGIAIANPSPVPVIARVALTDASGATAGEREMTVPGNGQLKEHISSLFPGLPIGFSGVLRVTATSPISAVGLRTRYNEVGEYLFTLTPTVLEGNDTVPAGLRTVLPVARGAGYSTDLLLYNRNQNTSNRGSLIPLSDTDPGN